MKKSKQSKPFLTRIWVIVFGLLTFLSLILAIITDGFQIREIFGKNVPAKNSPVIDIRVDPFEYNYFEGGNYQLGTVAFSIQTSNGSYQLLDSMKFYKLIVTKPDFFVNDGKNANAILTEVTLDYMILDNHIPAEIGILKFRTDFILMGDKMSELASSKEKETIGIIIFSLPYKFENEIYFFAKEKIPIVVYYDDGSQ